MWVAFAGSCHDKTPLPSSLTVGGNLRRVSPDPLGPFNLSPEAPDHLPRRQETSASDSFWVLRGEAAIILRLRSVRGLIRCATNVFGFFLTPSL